MTLNIVLGFREGVINILRGSLFFRISLILVGVNTVFEILRGVLDKTRNFRGGS